MLYNLGPWTLVRIVDVSIIGESVFGVSTVFMFGMSFYGIFCSIHFNEINLNSLHRSIQISFGGVFRAFSKFHCIPLGFDEQSIPLQ